MSHKHAYIHNSNVIQETFLSNLYRNTLTKNPLAVKTKMTFFSKLSESVFFPYLKKKRETNKNKTAA